MIHVQQKHGSFLHFMFPRVQSTFVSSCGSHYSGDVYSTAWLSWRVSFWKVWVTLLTFSSVFPFRLSSLLPLSSAFRLQHSSYLSPCRKYRFSPAAWRLSPFPGEPRPCLIWNESATLSSDSFWTLGTSSASFSLCPGTLIESGFAFYCAYYFWSAWTGKSCGSANDPFQTPLEFSSSNQNTEHL